jgi:hypothetical protein
MVTGYTETHHFSLHFFAYMIAPGVAAPTGYPAPAPDSLKIKQQVASVAVIE